MGRGMRLETEGGWFGSLVALRRRRKRRKRRRRRRGKKEAD